MSWLTPFEETAARLRARRASQIVAAKPAGVTDAQWLGLIDAIEDATRFDPLTSELVTDVARAAVQVLRPPMSPDADQGISTPGAGEYALAPGVAPTP